MTTIIATALSIATLNRLADNAIALEHGSPLTRNELVAMCLVESSGNPSAVGDGGKAVGLFQFHAPTWKDILPSNPPRTDPLWQFRAAIRYAKRNAALRRGKRLGPTARSLWMAHNAGNVRGHNTGYADRCERTLKTLSPI